MLLNRRQVILGAAGAALYAKAASAEKLAIFDSHLHIIDHRFPIVPNQGYTPPHYPLETYLEQAKPLGVRGGAVVSGSFHGFDQSYLRATLTALGPGWIGVTQVPDDIPDQEIEMLSKIGVRALRFNMFRGRIDSVDQVVSLASRAHGVGGWHAEVYADAAALKPHVDKLATLKSLVIDHLGMTEQGVPVVLALVSAGQTKVKATGFGRVSLNVPDTLEKIAAKDPSALVFGTDLPSTRAKRPFEPSDVELVVRTLGEDMARRVFWDNALSLYRLDAVR